MMTNVRGTATGATGENVMVLRGECEFDETGAWVRLSKAGRSSSAAATAEQGGAAPSAGSSSAAASANANLAGNSRTYDLYDAEADVNREKRTQRHLGAMASSQVMCVCPLMLLR
uniref:Uncharacterized protein n=1 Tax=Anopheles epiroticus TaxID=199890 RepID=A0A182PR17_9DIPT